MWWEAYGGIDLYGGRADFLTDDSRDMFAIRYADGMTIDVGTPDNGGIYCVTVVSSDDVEGWNRPLYEIETASKPELCGAVGDTVRKFRPKRDPVDKNALVSEILYVLLVRCKECGRKYKYSVIKQTLALCIELTKLLYKDSFGDNDKAVLNDGFTELSRYLGCAYSCYRAEDLVFTPLITPEPANMMLVLLHEILRTGSRASCRSDAAVMMHALHNLPRAYMTRRAEYFIESSQAARPEEVIKYSDADLKLLKNKIGFERVIYRFADISTVDEKGISFIDGCTVSFTECAENRRLQYPDSISVAQRDITADPPYIDFFTSFMPTRIVFDKKGLSAQKHNGADLRTLCENIKKAGYKTYDLS